MRRKGKTIGFLPSLFLERCIIIVICRTKGWGNPSNSHRLVNLKPPVVPVGCHTSGCLSAAKASGGRDTRTTCLLQRVFVYSVL